MIRALPKVSTLADFIKELGVSPDRIRMNPLPGTATERDLIAMLDRKEGVCELVDGVLVDKVIRFKESILANWISHLLWVFLTDHDLGIAAGADGPVRLQFSLVRIPDVCFVSWKKLPGREIPEDPIPDLVPDLAVEVISKGKTPAEMLRKLREYLRAGVRLVWYVYPKSHTVEVYSALDQRTVLSQGEVLDGGEVLPGFRLPLKKLFAVPGRPSPRRRRPTHTQSRRKRKSS